MRGPPSPPPLRHYYELVQWVSRTANIPEALLYKKPRWTYLLSARPYNELLEFERNRLENEVGIENPTRRNTVANLQKMGIFYRGINTRRKFIPWEKIKKVIPARPSNSYPFLRIQKEGSPKNRARKEDRVASRKYRKKKN